MASDGNGTITIFLTKDGSRPPPQNKTTFGEIPVYDNSFVANQALQVCFLSFGFMS